MQREEKKREVMEAEVSLQRLQMKYKVGIFIYFYCSMIFILKQFFRFCIYKYQQMYDPN